MHIPDFFVRNFHDSIPERNVVVPLDPFRAEISIEQEAEFLSNPRWSVNAVRDGCNRNLVLGRLRPYNLPHSTRYTSMQMTNGVSPPRHLQSQDRHIEGVTKTAEIHELLF